MEIPMVEAICDGIERDDRLPFVHRFQTKSHKYVLDVNTRRILKLSPAVWDVLGDFGRMDAEQLVARHSPPHTPEAVAAAVRDITDAQERSGLLLANRPKNIRPARREKVQEALAGGRRQLILNVTEECNFRCSYCVFSGDHPHRRAHSSRGMSWDVARAAIDDFLTHSGQTEARTISFYGGEPLLCLPLIRSCVAYVRGKYPGLKVQFSLTTNGSLLKGDAAALLASEGFFILVSLDGPEEMQDRNRRTIAGEPTWQRVMRNLRDFVREYPEYKTNGMLRFNAVVTASTDLRRLQEFVDGEGLFTEEMGLNIMPQNGGAPLGPDDLLVRSARDLRVEFIGKLKEGHFNDKPNSKADWVEIDAFGRMFVQFHKRGYISPHIPETVVAMPTCIPGERRTFVSIDGRYAPCERVCDAPEMAIGDVFQGVNIDRVVALLDRFNDASRDECRYCWCVGHCGVGCLATVSDDGKLTQPQKAAECARHRRQTHQMLTEYCEVLEDNPEAFDFTANIVLS